jgi:hypothetical protein
MGIPNSLIVDDWFTAAQQLKQVLAQMSQMSSVFESIGFTMQSEKYKYGQQVLFLGILIDSTTMTPQLSSLMLLSQKVSDWNSKFTWLCLLGVNIWITI